MNPTASIIICTQNRAQSLRETLASIAYCVVPSDLPAELLVVDNGSTDDTQEVVESAAITNMPVRYIDEPRRGKGYAYNAGMEAAQGDVLLFTDDDVRVPQNWIEGMSRRILSEEVDALAGGVVFPQSYERRLSEEPLRHLRGWFAATESQIDPVAPDRVIGANMAFSRRVLKKVREFDPALGPGALGFFDETLFSMQLLKAGYRIGSALDIRVEHHFALDRVSRSSLLSLAERVGRSVAYMDYHWSHTSHALTPTNTIRRGLHLLAIRLAHPLVLARGSVTLAEIRAMERYAYARQIVKEAQGPRNYERYGLIRRNRDGFVESRAGYQRSVPT